MRRVGESSHRSGNSFLPVALVLAAGLLAEPTRAQKGDPLKEFKQVVPRGRIEAITDPTFVPASEAGISDNAWILGVQIDGEARAFSLNLLTSHEAVNDTIGDTAYAAVW